MQIYSEIGQLKKVLLHKPGKELEHLIPKELERLLFDDIPYLKTAREEHDAFADTLRSQGVEVVYLCDLMAETLRAEPELKEQFIRQLILEGGSKPRNLVQRENRFLLDPIPNLYFTRDPFTVIGRGVSLNRMYSDTRKRETIFAQYILAHHPEYSPGLRYYYHREYLNRIEGGDILVLSRKVIALGISQRTTPEAIETLAKNLFLDETGEVETVLALDIPRIRAFMHLDTVCTQLDRDKFLVHPGILGTLRVFEIRKGNGISGLTVRELNKDLKSILSEYTETDRVTLIKCGGSDRIVSEREQWNDGSNTLCVRPGTVIAYDRNNVTNRLLREHGITVLEIPSSELSRGRGGPRCMSCPLEREPV